jgi:alpha-tubulin suppressor-like RCC1 family protein
VVYFQKPEDFLLKKKRSVKEMELWAWGSNNYGQLGLGHINEQYEEPVQVQT